MCYGSLMPTLNVANRTLFHGDNLPFLRNRTKSNMLTLSGLRIENKKRGRMASRE